MLATLRNCSERICPREGARLALPSLHGIFPGDREKVWGLFTLVSALV